MGGHKSVCELCKHARACAPFNFAAINFARASAHRDRVRINKLPIQRIACARYSTHRLGCCLTQIDATPNTPAGTTLARGHSPPLHASCTQRVCVRPDQHKHVHKLTHTLTFIYRSHAVNICPKNSYGVPRVARMLACSLTPS